MANLFTGISDFLSGGQLNDALERLTRSSEEIRNIPVPDLMALIPQLKLQVQQGNVSPAVAEAAFAKLQGVMNPAEMEYATAVMQGSMTPAQATAAMQQDSAMGGVQSDAQSIQGQRTALAQLADIGENKGLTEADRAQLAAVMNQTNANAAQQRAAQIQQLQMQGNAGTGAELAARLSGVQGAANQNAAMGADVAKAAQARALQAIQSGLVGNANLNSQMFDQAAKKAQAQDAVNQFNTQARNTIGLSNAQMAQQANQQNFQTANQIALANQAAQQQAYQQNAQNQQAANLANYNTGNQFALQNANNQQAANLANAGYGQQANLANFQMANAIGANNTAIANQQATLPYNAAQADFTNQLNKATGASAADYRAGGVMADLAGKQMGNTAGMIDAAGNFINSAAGQQAAKWVVDAATGVGKWVYDNAGEAGDWLSGAWDTVSEWFSDEDLKTNKKQLSDSDVDQIMAHMTGYQYRYKGPKTNPTQVGVMAQDMPKESVIDTPAGKMIQGPQAMNQALAVLANQHARIKKLEGK